ncbi:MAG: hypothetical protein ABI895_32075 [Deltaproteobacteria bacterium]
MLSISSSRALKPVWAALSLAVCACAARASLDTPISDPAAARRPEPEPAPPPAPDPLRELWLQVARVRGLEPGPLPALVALPARQLARRAREQVSRDVPEAVRRAQAHLLWRLGLVPADFDLSVTLESTFVGQLQAFYVGTPPTVFVDRALGGAARQRALAHELVHALQDQRHALSRRLAYEPDGWDRQSALHALAEADALAVVERLGGAETTDRAAIEPASPAAVPGVIACSLAAPYLDARARVSELLASGGFAAVDALLENPPPGTHQLLHPGEPAVSGGAEPPFRAPGSDWSAVYGDVLGEQSLRCVLTEWASESVAVELAGSWVADRVSCFVNGASIALVWELTFAQRTRASEVARLLLTHLDLRRAPGRTSAPPPEWLCGAHSDTGVVGVLQRGARLVFASQSGVPVSGGCVSLESWVRGTRPG